MKKLFAVLAATTLVLTGITAANADAYFTATDSLPVGSARFSVDEAGKMESISRLLVISKRANSHLPDEYFCDGYGVNECNLDNAKYNLADSVLIAPKCVSATQINCIESLSVYQNGSDPVEANFIRHINGDTVDADTSRNLTAGSTVSLWNAAGAEHQGGQTTYSANVAFRVTYLRSTHKFKIDGIIAGIQPYNEVKGLFEPNERRSSITPSGRHQVGFGIGDPSCVWSDYGLCGKGQDFADNARASIKLRVAKTVGGWFSGRMSDADIQIKSLSATANQVVITANPVSIPRFSVVVKKSNLSAAGKKFIAKQFTGSFDPFNIGGKFGGGQGTRSDYIQAFEYLDAFRQDGKDTAAGTSSAWNFQNSFNGMGSNCLKDSSRVAGLVTTNSMMYQAAAPDFIGGYLNYKVGGMHYLPDGKTAAKGTYDLIIRSDTARCLYKFSDAPLNASVSVVNENGVKTTATTVVSEKDGWLKLSANNFTFSKKTIKVKITKKKK